MAVFIPGAGFHPPRSAGYPPDWYCRSIRARFGLPCWPAGETLPGDTVGLQLRQHTDDVEAVHVLYFVTALRA
ncbi:hypothetical protein ACWCYL_43705 [Streptomyces sp. 900105755]